MRDAERLRWVEDKALKYIRMGGWPVLPFGLGDWTERNPELGACIDGDDTSALRTAPDAIAMSTAGIVFVEVINSNGHDNHALDLPKLVQLCEWAHVGRVLVLDVSGWGVRQYTRELVRETCGADGPRPGHKPYALIPKQRDEHFADYWPERGTA